ncbi:oligosaccharide flippase family protein [Piscinibacter terrae]|nr:oligosaccharide flippase family protein [Albitalea terrae]
MAELAAKDGGETMSEGAPKESLRQRVIRAGGWTIFGLATSQVLRFGSNLILTRLLFPEAFGLMALVQSVLAGVALLSDVGISQSIVISAKGADQRYVHTAWTVQICKGALIALVLLGLAHPVAAYYKQPLLAQLLPMVALVAFFDGFVSIKVALSNRNVDAKRVTLIEVGALFINIVVATLLALRDPTPWALAWGYMTGELVKMLSSHLILKGPRDRFAWDPAVVRGIFSFGMWVMLSSSLTFLGGEGNRLIWGSVLDIRLLGLLGLATTINIVVWNLLKQVAGRVLLPAYSEVLRTSPERFSRAVERARFVQVAPAWCFAFVLVFGGPSLFHFLYDARYQQAGTIVQILAMGLMVDMLNGSFSGVLWAMKRIGISTVMQVALLACQIGGMLLGYWLHGKPGAIIGFAAAGWVLYPLHATVYARLGLWHPRIDIPVLVASTAVVVTVALTNDWSALEAIK